MITTELKARYDTRASFYGKAKIETRTDDVDGHIVLRLISYNTHVATITKSNDGNGVGVWVGGWYSQTTSRHINEFLQQNGQEKMTKKQMEQGGC